MTLWIELGEALWQWLKCALGVCGHTTCPCALRQKLGDLLK